VTPGNWQQNLLGRCNNRLAPPIARRDTESRGEAVAPPWSPFGKSLFGNFAEKFRYLRCTTIAVLNP
jgi:hypothetical protein